MFASGFLYFLTYCPVNTPVKVEAPPKELKDKEVKRGLFKQEVRIVSKFVGCGGAVTHTLYAQEQEEELEPVDELDKVKLDW
jgi:hypothetical protein